jgi:hypothetical protein
VSQRADYYENAGYLVKRYEKREDYLRIQIEDAAYSFKADSHM